MPEKQAHEISHHILAASTTLLGISFAVVSLIGAMGHADKTLADEFALLSLILFLDPASSPMHRCGFKKGRPSTGRFRTRCSS